MVISFRPSWPRIACYCKTISAIRRDMDFGCLKVMTLAAIPLPPSMRTWGAIPLVQEGYLSDPCVRPHESQEKMDVIPALEYYLVLI